jgi:small subunit ribosomal protein S7
MMWQGKKSINTRIMYDAMEAMQKKANVPALEVFLKALDNAKPLVEVKSRRVGGATYQVPVEIRDTRREALAMRWLIAAARNRSGKAMADKLADELLDAFNNTGTAVKKKEDTHKMAEANKAFAHYRW